MLQLIVNNTSMTKTCASQCKLYDESTQTCSIWKDIDGTDPKYFSSCKDRVQRTPEKTHPHGDDLNNDSMIDSFSGLNYQSSKQKLSHDVGYPIQPDYRPAFDDLIWYVSPDQTFGCWLYYENRRYRLALTDSLSDKPEKQIKQYISHVPLHDHGTSAHLASNMVWYVQTDGTGSYRFIIDDEIFNL